jgi:aminomethyltransferase
MPKLALHDLHLAAGAKMVFWGGFTMPQEFQGLVTEHMAVREHVGVFDVSHMGRIRVEGKDALPFIQSLFTNDLFNIAPNKAVYGLFCKEDGYPIDDLFVYVEKSTSLLLVVNAINLPNNLKWLNEHIKTHQVTITDITLSTNQLAIQGPLAESVLQSLITKKVELSQLKFMHYIKTHHQGHELLISRSGYTGSDGFEVYGNLPVMRLLYEALLATKVQPCGLGARDTLRFEASLPLYSHELSDHISPIEAGLNFAIKLNHAFIGHEALKQQMDQGTEGKLVGLQILSRGVARAEYEVRVGEETVGHITTGYILPKQTQGLAMAYVKTPFSKPGTKVTVMMRTTPLDAVVRDMIFMQKQYKR